MVSWYNLASVDRTASYVRFDRCPPIDFDSMALTQNLTPEQRRAIDAEWVSKAQVQQFLEVFNSENGMQTLLEGPDAHKDLPSLGLRARAAEKISDAQFATLCFVYQAINQLIFEQMSVRDYNLPNAEGVVEIFQYVWPISLYFLISLQPGPSMRLRPPEIGCTLIWVEIRSFKTVTCEISPITLPS